MVYMMQYSKGNTLVFSVTFCEQVQNSEWRGETTLVKRKIKNGEKPKDSLF